MHKKASVPPKRRASIFSRQAMALASPAMALASPATMSLRRGTGISRSVTRTLSAPVSRSGTRTLSAPVSRQPSRAFGSLLLPLSRSGSRVFVECAPSSQRSSAAAGDAISRQTSTRWSEHEMPPPPSARLSEGAPSERQLMKGLVAAFGPPLDSSGPTTQRRSVRKAARILPEVIPPGGRRYHAASEAEAEAKAEAKSGTSRAGSPAPRSLSPRLCTALPVPTSETAELPARITANLDSSQPGPGAALPPAEQRSRSASVTFSSEVVGAT